MLWLKISFIINSHYFGIFALEYNFLLSSLTLYYTYLRTQEFLKTAIVQYVSQCIGAKEA